jgi:hypothetical protein
LIEDDISLAMQNPALLTGVSDKTVGFSFMTYMQGCNTGAAAYSQQVGARGNWGVQARFVGDVAFWRRSGFVQTSRPLYWRSVQPSFE